MSEKEMRLIETIGKLAEEDQEKVLIYAQGIATGCAECKIKEDA